MTNLECREWVENALAYWRHATPHRNITRKIINWNIEMLERARETAR